MATRKPRRTSVEKATDELGSALATLAKTLNASEKAEAPKLRKIQSAHTAMLAAERALADARNRYAQAIADLDTCREERAEKDGKARDRVAVKRERLADAQRKAEERELNQRAAARREAATERPNPERDAQARVTRELERMNEATAKVQADSDAVFEMLRSA